MNRYPHVPGSRPGSPETSCEAAEHVAPVAASIRARVLSTITQAGEAGLTGDQVASALDLSVYQVRSRIAELGAANVVADSGRRGQLASGLNGAIWVLRQFVPDKPDDRQADWLAAA